MTAIQKIQQAAKSALSFDFLIAFRVVCWSYRCGALYACLGVFVCLCYVFVRALLFALQALAPPTCPEHVRSDGWRMSIMIVWRLSDTLVDVSDERISMV